MNKIYCKHCGKLIDADSAFCMHCGGTIQDRIKKDESFIRLIDALGAKAIIWFIINPIKWVVNLLKRAIHTLIRFFRFLLRNWKRILIFIFGISISAIITARATILADVKDIDISGMLIIPAILLTIATLYFSCSKSIKFLATSGVLLLCAYGVYIHWKYEHIYGSDTTFFDTIKREFYWITPNYTISDGVTLIGNRAFWYCDLLKSVTIPDSVTSIEELAFSNCTSLTSVTIPNSVTSIEFAAFYGCTSLTNVAIGNGVTSIGGLAFSDCTSLTSVTIPDSVTSIGGSAFSRCSKLRGFKGKFASTDNRCLIIDGVLNSFAPSGLTTYTIPNSVTSIESSAFPRCDSLKSVTIPDSVTSIGCTAFYSCTSLTNVAIGNGVTSIGWQAFGNCDSLIEVYCKPTTPPTSGSNMFDNNASGRKIYVPRNSVSKYKSAYGWSEYADYIVGYDFK